MTQLVSDDWIIKRFNLWLVNPCPSKLRKESLLFFKQLLKVSNIEAKLKLEKELCLIEVCISLLED